MFAPANTPRSIIDRVNREVVRILREPDFRQRISSMGADIVGSSPNEWGQFMVSEIEKWTKIAKIAGFKAD